MKFPVDHYASGEYLYSKMMNPVCDEFGLTHMELTVLMFLANNPCYDTAAIIVKLRRLTKSHVSISIRSLQQQGLLTGEYRDDDHRTIHLMLTKKADPIIHSGRIAQDKFYEALLSGFTEDEKQYLIGFAARIDNNIKHQIQKFQ